MRYAIGFSVFVFVLFLGSIEAAYSEPFDMTDLTPTYIQVDLEVQEGVMVAEWQGRAALEAYENRWLDFVVFDVDSGGEIGFQMWFHTWRRVCDPPCELTVSFLIRNVTVVTK